MEKIQKETGSPLLQKIIQDELGGKYAGIHAYDKYMWTVRSGYLTLVFGAWGFFVKSALEAQNVTIDKIRMYIIILAIMTILLSIGAFLIDRNYGRRKFRVINAVNAFMKLVVSRSFNLNEEHTIEKLAGLLQISGDASNDTYKCSAYQNELFVGAIIFILPLFSAFAALIYCVFIL